jgi:hypothetical protein
METKGALWEGVLPDLLRQLYVGRRSGTLLLTREGERRGVRFYVGNIVNAETNVRQDRMGELLVRQGVLVESELMEATGRIHRERRKLGDLLVEMGFLEREALREVVAQHVDVVLSRVFAWSEGQYEFREELGRTLDAEELALPYSTGDLILRASRSVRDPDIVRYRLGDLERPISLSRDPLLRFQRLNLSAADGAVLERADGHMTAAEIVHAAGFPPEEVRTSLFALLNTGIIEYAGSTRRGHPAALAAPKEEAPSPVVLAREPSHEPIRDDTTVPLPRPDIPKEAEAALRAAWLTGAPPSSAPPPSEQAPSKQAPPPLPGPLQSRRAEIVEAHASLGTRTHFELLGLTPEADDAQLREAYFRQAKRFHPDAHHEPGLGDLRDALEAVFVRLGEVYETLRSPRLRARYVRELQAAAGPTTGEATPAGADLPEDVIARAAECIERERYWEALPLLERAIPRAEGGVKQRGRILLARLYARDPDWIGQAEELLELVRDDEPGNTDVHFYLGQIYEHQGQVERALAAFRKVLELEPQSKDARARVAELEQR